jgi:phosphate transport system permease protein
MNEPAIDPAAAGDAIHPARGGARLLQRATGLERRRARTNRIVRVVAGGATLLTIVPLLAIIGFVLAKGLPTLTLQFLQNPASDPTHPGALNAIAGSLQMVPVALLISGSVGLLAGIYLAEFARPRVAEAFGFIVDVLLGVPSIIAGLLIYATLVAAAGSSALAGAVALAVVMFPIVVRTTEEVLRLVPGSLREASLALGIPMWRTTLSVVLRTARAGILTALMLAFARGFGETAPLIFTARGSDSLHVGDFGSTMSALPLFVYQNSRLPSKFFVSEAWSAAIVLLAIVLLINVIVRGRSINSRVD